MKAFRLADSSLNSALNLHGKLEKFPTYQSLLQRGNSKIFLNFCIMQLNCQILKYPKSGLVVYINCHRRKKMHRVQNRQFNSRSIHFWSQHKSSILQMYKKTFVFIELSKASYCNSKSQFKSAFAQSCVPPVLNTFSFAPLWGGSVK